MAPLKLLATTLVRQKRDCHRCCSVSGAAGKPRQRSSSGSWNPISGPTTNPWEEKGLASQALAGHLNAADGEAELFACGPPPMLSAIAAIATERDLNLQVALDSHMACGIGSCQGCVTRTKRGFAKVCTDGPVFNAQELAW